MSGERRERRWAEAFLPPEYILNRSVRPNRKKKKGGAWSSWRSLVTYNKTTWVTCRFHLAEWPSCHISKDSGAGLAKRYGWVMGCCPHPDTLGRWGAAASTPAPTARPSWPLFPVHSAYPPALLHADICQTSLSFSDSITWWCARNKERWEHNSETNTLNTINLDTNQQVSSLQIRVTKRVTSDCLLANLFPGLFFIFKFFLNQNVNFTLGHRDTKGAPEYAADSRIWPSKS